MLCATRRKYRLLPGCGLWGTGCLGGLWPRHALLTVPESRHEAARISHQAGLWPLAAGAAPGAGEKRPSGAFSQRPEPLGLQADFSGQGRLYGFQSGGLAFRVGDFERQVV